MFLKVIQNLLPVTGFVYYLEIQINIRDGFVTYIT